ncbi:hypothetical protein QMY55_08355 [Comamonas resistens]|uniref:Uncharacterized protein n=1 Tax=Comamonas resistens TaxID=3046670 RepID=A0ABY8SW13_9BURK|nr:hypothetical protein [Comamonas resistens]WHS67113.1 hypothetical protein QMY55_08355 [Comamonas resistens]
MTCLHQIQEPEADIWPCVNIDVDESGKITNAKLYSPGLPAGNHDVYPVRVPYMDEHTEAWLACAAELRKHLPEFMHLRDMNGIECAVAAIRELAERSAPVQAAPAAVAVPDDWKLVPIAPTEAMLIAIMSEGEEDAARELDQKLLGELMERAGMQQRYANVLAAAPALTATPAGVCTHRIADARNHVVKSGYLCVDCGALFSAADHDATPAAAPTYIEVRECSDCGHVGINDADGSKAACSKCDWQGESPVEDRCPDCNTVGTMTAACAKCGSRASLIAETHLLTGAAAPVVLPEPAAWINQRCIVRDGECAGHEPQELNFNRHGDWDKSIALFTEQQVRALLAQAATTGLPAQSVEQVPVLYVSKEQLDHHRDPDGPDSANAGRYLPARKTPAGKLTTPLFAAPQAQTQADARDAIRDLIAIHSAELEQNEYAYFELAHTRQTGWCAWITDHPRSMPPMPTVNPDRKVIASGQGDTPEEACSAAIAAAKGEQQ